MDAPEYAWLLDLVYVIFLLKHTYAAGITCITISNSSDYTVYIIPLLCFGFWKPVYCKVGDSNFPSNNTENMAGGLVLLKMLDMLLS